MVQTLVAQRLEPVIVDVTPVNPEYMGDAGHEEIMVHAGLAEVCMAVDDIPKI